MDLKSTNAKGHGQSWCFSSCLSTFCSPDVHIYDFLSLIFVVFPLLFNCFTERKGVLHSTLTTIKTLEVYTSDILGCTYLISPRDRGITWPISLYIPEGPVVEKKLAFLSHLPSSSV